ncbi:MAG TPA: spermidine/putrescine ABC transporter substrate-binding protein [Acidimicrobiales bacterium]|nr:spermidine/putrescine ABC transporter substrate-binding protein [Acidimicrobiales bacterium]
MTFHPRQRWGEGERERPNGLSRREFLRRMAAIAGSGVALRSLGGVAPVLDRFSIEDSSKPSIPLPRPNSPVKWPLFNKTIASNLKPERNATLKLYNWVAYINQAVVNSFEKTYKCKVEITTFNTMEEAVAKLRAGESFDVFVPTVDVLGQLIEGKLLRPLNHSYIPNISQTWSDFTNPWYDQKWQYTVPYTIYTTGIAWRKDHVPENPYTMKNAWAMPWQSKYRGKVAILDDYREGIALGLMKNGIYNLNTTESSQLSIATQSLLDLDHLVNLHIDINDYSNVPSGQIWIHEAWSGDMAAAAGYMPKGVSVDVIGYWFPTDGKGPVGNDTMAVLASGKNPVLAHLFLNYFLDFHNAVENISYNGYMQPLTAITPQLLVKEKILPKTLMSTVVLPSYFRKGVGEYQLPAAADAAWQQAWLQISQGI